MDKLLRLINELEACIPYSEKSNPAVSKSSVGWHIQHCLLVGMKIINAVEKSDPEKYRWKFNLMKTLVYTLNKIPRGKAKAPDAVQPKDPFNTDTLIRDVAQLKQRIGILPGLKPNNYFEHPYFGNLNLKATTRMLRLHTKHHLDIINDIIKV